MRSQEGLQIGNRILVPIMKNQSCDGFPGGVAQSGVNANRPRQGGGHLVAGSSSDRMMVTTDIGMPRSDGNEGVEGEGRGYVVGGGRK